MPPARGENQRIPDGVRWALTLVGLGFSATGAVAAFLARNDIAATALVIAGALGLLFAAVGRWPQSIVVAGTGTTLFSRAAGKALDSAIDTAPEQVAPALLAFRSALEDPEHSAYARSAAEYVDQIAEVLARRFPGGRILRSGNPARDTADFEVLRGDRSLLVETRFVDPTASFHARTLPDLLAGLPGQRVLVVVNTRDIAPAQHTLAGAHEVSVVTWLGPEDDEVLYRSALTLLS